MGFLKGSGGSSHNSGYGGYGSGQGYGGGYGQGGYGNQPVYAQQGKKHGGMGGAGMLAAGNYLISYPIFRSVPHTSPGAGVGLLGGLAVEEFIDHEREEGYEEGYDNGYDNGFDNDYDDGGF